MRFVARAMTVCLLFALAACTVPGTPVPAPVSTTPAPAVTVTRIAPTPLPVDSPTPEPTVTPTATLIPTATLTAALATALAPTVPPTPEPGPGVEGIAVAPLEPNGVAGPAGGGLWVAWTYGLRSFTTEQKHFVAIYTQAPTGTGDEWSELARVDLETADYLDQHGALQQVQVTPGSIWIELHSGAGAHAGCFDLLRFDGQHLTLPIEHCTATPGGGASTITDVNRDGTPDVLLDDTDPYVFCYACGVRLYQWHVLRWNGTDFEEVELAPLPDSATAAVRDPLNQAVLLAGGEMWKEAYALALQAEAFNPTDPVAQWDIALIKLTAESRADPGPFPLLGYIFYGDYPAAIDLMRAYEPEALFSRPSALTSGDEMLTGWEADLSRWITTFTTSALGVQPDLAAAYFLRGWAEYQVDPQDPAALSDLQQAAALSPEDALYSRSVEYLTR